MFNRTNINKTPLDIAADEGHKEIVTNIQYTSEYLKKTYPNLPYKAGSFTYGTPRIRFPIPDAELYIGKFCSISNDADILMSGEHDYSLISSYPFGAFKDIFPESTMPITHTKGNVYIGNDVWIGSKAIILSGTTIGNGCVIGANSVISGYVEPYSIVIGNPATIIKKRFTPQVIGKLESIKWWDWPIDKIQKHQSLFENGDIDEFINKFYEIN